MLLYALAMLIGFVAGLIYMSNRPGAFEKNITNKIMQGKRVMICIDGEATVFQLQGSRVSVTQADVSFYTGEENVSGVDSVQPDQPD